MLYQFTKENEKPRVQGLYMPSKLRFRNQTALQDASPARPIPIQNAKPQQDGTSYRTLLKYLDGHSAKSVLMVGVPPFTHVKFLKQNVLPRIQLRSVQYVVFNERLNWLLLVVRDINEAEELREVFDMVQINGQVMIGVQVGMSRVQTDLLISGEKGKGKQLRVMERAECEREFGMVVKSGGEQRRLNVDRGNENYEGYVSAEYSKWNACDRMMIILRRFFNFY